MEDYQEVMQQLEELQDMDYDDLVDHLETLSYGMLQDEQEMGYEE